MNTNSSNHLLLARSIAEQYSLITDDVEYWDSSFVCAFLRRYPRKVRLLVYFKEVVGHIPLWDDVTDENVRTLREITLEHMCGSSARQYLACMRSVVNDYMFEKNIPLRNIRHFNVKNTPSQAIFLTEQEIELICNYKPRSRCEAYVKRIFLIGCYTGARTSDARHLSLGNIWSDGFLHFITEKTKREVVIPVHRSLPPLLSSLQDISYHYRNNREMSYAQFNQTIQRICRNVGISHQQTLFRFGRNETSPRYRFVGSHTARRSFATNLFLRGANIFSISQLMGHSSERMTSKYIIVKKGIDPSVMPFFLE